MKNHPPEVIPPSKLQQFTGLSKTSVWRLERKGDFPRKIRLSAGRVGYRRADIEKWLEDRATAGMER